MQGIRNSSKQAGRHVRIGTSRTRQTHSSPSPGCSRAFLDYLVDVRTAVEGKVVELVAKRADADLSAVCAVLKRTEAEIGKSFKRGSLDLRFETTLTLGAGNPC